MERRAVHVRVAVMTVALCTALAAFGCGRSAPSDPEAAEPLLGSWEMESYRDGDQMKPLLPGSEVTCEFGTELVSGSAGMNEFHGSYRVEAGRLRIGTLESGTDEGPSDFAAQERAFLADLGRARSFSLEDGRLTLAAKGGDVLLTFVRGTQGEVVGAWTCTGYDAGLDVLTEPAAEQVFTLDLGEGGSVSGEAPAGTFVGTYETTGTAGILIDQVELLAEGGAGRDSSAPTRHFLDSLAGARSYELGPGTLALEDADGYVLATFESAE